MHFSQTQARLALLAAGVAIATLAVLPSNPEASEPLGLDKLKHLMAFAVLTVLARISWPALKRWRLALGLTGFGVAIELAQGLTGWGRTASVADVLADLIGLVLGLVIFEALRRWRSTPDTIT